MSEEEQPPFKKGEERWRCLLTEEGPPHNTWVETWGGTWSNSTGKSFIIKDYIHGQIGDWMCQQGDPSHWRPIKK